MRSLAFNVWGPVLLLLVATIAVFYNHILGNLTFPWDFHGPYFTHAVARMRDGSFVSPPLWMPWGGFGVPAAQSLQDGAWYLPQYLFDFFGWKYDLVGATRLQVAHVFFGALGALFFIRKMDASRLSASVASLAFVFNPAFFSNSQHVDIVRGTALLPWLFYALILLFRRLDAGSFLIFVLILWQFLVGAYPGMVVSAAYACVVIAAFELYLVRQKTRSLWPLVLVSLAVALSIGLSMVKFLPALADFASMRQSAGQVSGVTSELLTTLLLDFDLDGMPNDLTMRDMFVGLPIFWLSVVGAVTARSNKNKLPLVLLVVALIPMVTYTPIQSLVAELPLMDVSRFHISDFRPILHLAMLVFAAYGCDQLLRNEKSRALTASMVIGAVLVIVLSMYGWHLGQFKEAFVWPLVAALCMLPAVVFWLAGRSAEARGTAVVAICLLSAVAISGCGHALRSERVWRMPRSDEAEVAAFGTTIRELLSTSVVGPVEYRPTRALLTPLPATRGELYDERYNFAWLAQGYAAFGYENMATSQTLSEIYGAAVSQEESGLLMAMRWMIERSSVKILPDLSVFDLHELSGCVGVCVAPSIADDALVRMIAFRREGAVYEVNAVSAFAMVENELYYSGWAALVCGFNDVCADAPVLRAQPVGSVLRGWSLPPGRYRFMTYYQPPAWSAAAHIAKISAILASLIFFVLLFVTKKRSIALASLNFIR
jgi:hypothetical protein